MIVRLVKTLMVLTMFNLANAESLTLGQLAPDFELLDQSGNVHSLQKYRGQWVILYFYPKNDTPGCTKEACAFRDEYKTITAKNAQVLGVSVDDQDSHKKFTEKYSLPFPLLADTDGEVAKQYGSLRSLGFIKLAKRHSFIINPEGEIAVIYRDVNPDNHSQEVLDDIGRLQSS
jgi:peroxiredoxin Q/BCP